MTEVHCDLCNAVREIPWTYVTWNEAVSVAEAAKTGKFWAEDPGWAVCQTCHEIIQSEPKDTALERLIAYSIKSQLGNMFILGDDTSTLTKMFIDEVCRIHTQFMAHIDSYYPEPGYRMQA